MARLGGHCSWTVLWHWFIRALLFLLVVGISRPAHCLSVYHCCSTHVSLGRLSLNTRPLPPARVNMHIDNRGAGRGPPQDVRLLDSFTQRRSLRDTVGRSAKLVVSAMATIVLLATTSPLPLFYTTIAVLNGIIGKALKITLRQPRPSGSPKTDYGMPSTHTAAIVYFALVLHFTSHHFLPTSRLDTLQHLLDALAVSYTALACSYRVRARLHTVPQIAAGAVLGGCFAALAISQQALIADQLMSTLTIWQLLVLKFVLAAIVLPNLFKKEFRALFKSDK